jgi:hypothetical protein
MFRHIISLIIVIFCFSCRDSDKNFDEGPFLFDEDKFKGYWYAGKAEVNAYELDQSRYGENHKGHAVLIFVTEDLSKSKQVKLDYPEQVKDDKVSVLKLNYIKNFTTGIYPYAMMLSVFTPVQRNQHRNTLKLSMSVQEWCGHVYTQLNLKGNSYEGLGHSYFEQEGDSNFKLPAILLEDELLNLIRLDPQKLPIGERLLIPGMFASRTKHEALKPLQANLTLRQEDAQYVYFINYADVGRNLSIYFDVEFPHSIKSWEEQYIDNYGRKHETKANLIKDLYIDYWAKNKNEFLYLRDSLGLPLHY